MIITILLILVIICLIYIIYTNKENYGTPHEDAQMAFSKRFEEDLKLRI